MILDKLKEIPKKKSLYIITVLAIIVTVIITILMGPNESFLKSTTGYGVMEFELAWTVEVINTIFIAWGSEGMQLEAINTYIDFAFIPAYVILSACLLLIAARRLEGRFQVISLVMVLTPLLAGLFDVIENIHLLLMISDSAFITTGSPFIASICATLKFGILFLDIGYFLIALIYGSLKKS